MTTTTTSASVRDDGPATASVETAARRAYWLLYVGFVAAPILAGLDKFFHVLADWDAYVAPFVNSVLGGYGSEFMLVAGVIEVIAGIGVFLKPRIFSYVVAAWLGGIILNLLLLGDFLDVALRDLGLLLGALALGTLSNARASES